jgi:drug/metabolite transporter (DMT)-like permease
MAFVAQRVGMEFIGPFLFSGVRMLFGALTLIVVLLISEFFAARRAKTEVPVRFPVAKWLQILKAGLVCGLIIFLAGGFQQIGLVSTTASKAGFLTTLYIVLVPILGIVLKQKTHWNTWVSVFIAAVGLYFLCLTGGFSIQFGDTIVLVSALFWACHILVIDQFVKGVGKREVMRLCITQFAVASILSFIAAPFLDGLLGAVGAFSFEQLIDALPVILYTGVLSTGVAFTLQAMGQQGLNPSAASIVMSLEAVFSVLGGMLILGEVLSGREILGCALMFAAIILSQLPVGRPKQPPSHE